MLTPNALIITVIVIILACFAQAILLSTRKNSRPYQTWLASAFTTIPAIIAWPTWSLDMTKSCQTKLLNYANISNNLFSNSFSDMIIGPLGASATPSIVLIIIAPATIFSLLSLERSWKQFFEAQFSSICLLIAGYFLCTTNSLIVLIIAFEAILLVALLLLQATSKSERILEATLEFFMWALVGSLFLLCAFGIALGSNLTSLNDLGSNLPNSALLPCLLILGFGVKVPLWPSFSWLLKAHVEASVEFSILLSGILVKAGIVGIIRTLEVCPNTFSTQLLLALSLIGCIEAGLRLLGQRDLKRIVALTTIIEMNWAVFALAWGGFSMQQTALLILIAHSFTTSTEFYIVELFYKRFGTRDITKISGSYTVCPTLWIMSFLTCLISIGFPGTSLFAAKLSFIGILFTTSPLLSILFLIGLFLIIPVSFLRIWTPIWFGKPVRKLQIRDLNSTELSLLIVLLFASLIIGIAPCSVLPVW